MTENIELGQAEEILKGFKLPPRPSIFAELKKVSPDLNKMSHIVEQDPALAASILKVVNSPAIGLANKVTSINHAMNLLGLRSIMNIINAAFMKRMLNSYKNSEQLSSFWYSTTKVASAMGAIAQKLDLQKSGISVDDAYCVGLFHNVGMPMLQDKHADYFETIRPAFFKENIGILEAENQLYDTNHTVLGFYMTKGWGLPKTISEVIKVHHAPDVLENLDRLDDDVAILLAALKMSEQITGEAEEFGGISYNKEWIQWGTAITSYMGLSIQDFFELEDFVFDTIEKEDNE